MTAIPQRSAEIVCLVDDDTAVLKSLGRLLASDGISVRSFDNPKNFLLHARENQVPLVVLDIWMEEMNGLDVQAKVSEISPATRVIVITGREDPNTEQTALQSGAVAFFTKPFDDAKFLSAVHSALETPA